MLYVLFLSFQPFEINRKFHKTPPNKTHVYRRKLTMKSRVSRPFGHQKTASPFRCIPILNHRLLHFGRFPLDLLCSWISTVNSLNVNAIWLYPASYSYLSVYLHIYIYLYIIYIYMCLSAHLFIYQSIYISNYLYYTTIYLSIDRSIDRSIYLSIYLPVYPSIYLSIWLTIYPFSQLSICRFPICRSHIKIVGQAQPSQNIWKHFFGQPSQVSGWNRQNLWRNEAQMT
jgi:hypothetical protein